MTKRGPRGAGEWSGIVVADLFVSVPLSVASALWPLEQGSLAIPGRHAIVKKKDCLLFRIAGLTAR